MGWDSESRSKSENEAHAAAVETIRRACERHGVTPGIHVGDAETSFRYAEQGFRLITVASDMGLIFGGSAATLARVRQAKIPASGRGAASGGRRGSTTSAASGARGASSNGSRPASSAAAKSGAKKGAKAAKSGKPPKAGSTPI
jgi:hypothetical protein